MEWAPTAEESREMQEKGFARLQKGKLFQVGPWRHFLAVRKMSRQEWEVVELTATNRQKIVDGQQPENTRLHFDQMGGIYIIQPTEDD